MPTFSTSERQKVARTPQFLTLLTWKCASCHNGVHFFDISTSKSGRNPWCFDTFDLEMCFAPRRRALFRHLNFQKCAERGVFYTFCLGKVLCATTACTFSRSQLPKVVRACGVLYILSWRATTACTFSRSQREKGAKPIIFYTFDLEMCFAPQQHALSRDLNVKKGAKPFFFLHF